MKASIYQTLITLVFILISHSLMAQQTATLDTDFGNGGIVKTQLFRSSDHCSDAVKTTDNKIIAVGSTYNGTDDDIVLIRYNQDGSLDESFGNNGIATTDIDGSDDFATHIVIDQLGFIIITAESKNNDVTTNYLLAFNDDGSIASFFGDNGKQTTPIKSNGLAIANDNDIIIVGTRDNNIMLMRYYSFGAINTSWGVDGIVENDLGYNNEIVYELKVDSQGRFVVVGNVDKNYLVVRYTDDGNFDQSFGEDGKVIGKIKSTKMAQANALVIDSTDRIYVAGYYGNRSVFQYVSCFILKLHTNGTRDSSFNNNGVRAVNWHVDTYHEASIVIAKGNDKIDIALTNNNIILSGLKAHYTGKYHFVNEIRTTSFNFDGSVNVDMNIPLTLYYSSPNRLIVVNDKVYLIGTHRKNSGFVFRLNKFLDNGKLDVDFGIGGQITTAINNYTVRNSSCSNISINSDNKIIVNASKTILTYNNDGTVDQTVDLDGAFTPPLGVRCNFIDGNNIVTGSVIRSSDAFPRLISRFTHNGIFDRSFGGGDGYSVGPRHIRNREYPTDIVKDNNGNYIMVGDEDEDDASLLMITRYTSSGQYDSAFGAVKVGLYVGEYRPSYAAITSDGKLVATGHFFKKGLGVVRLNDDGSKDESFGDNGIAEFQYKDKRIFNNGIVLDEQDRSFVIGYTHEDSPEYLLICFDKNGNVDKTFGENGYAILPINAKDLVLDGFGNIIITGSYNNGSDYDVAVFRYTSNGILDKSFGSYSGMFSTSIGEENDYGNSITIDQDGKIIVGATYYFGGNYSAAIIKINNPSYIPPSGDDGDLDDTFGDGGIVHTPIGDKSYSFNSVIDNNGKIVSVGTTIIDENPEFSIVRYNNDGSLDNSFGNDGKVITQIGEADDLARSVIIDNNEKIVVAGFTQVAGDATDQMDFAIVRYNADGSLDNSFGDDGKVITSLGPDYDFGAEVVEDYFNRLVVVGLTERNGQFDLGITRLTSDGNIDQTFGNNGVVTTELGLPLKLTNNPAIGTNKMSVMDVGFAWIEIRPDVVLDSDGRIVVAASAYINSKLVCLLSRYNNDGTIDENFGNNGIATVSIGNGTNYSVKVMIDSENKILLLTNVQNDCFYRFSLVRFNDDGILDESYGDNGISDFGYFPCENYSAKDAVIDELGRVIITVNSTTKEESIMKLYRITNEGWMDETLSEDGIVETSLDGTILIPEAVNIDLEGRIVVTGAVSDYSANVEFLAVRYHGSPIVDHPEDGELDIRYGENGFAFTSVNKMDICTNATIDSEGRMVLVGYTSPKINKNIPIVVRNTISGVPASSFGENGVVSLSDLDNINSVDIDSKGRIIVVGSNANKTDTYTTDSYDFAIARLMPNGNLDDNFGEGGIVLTNFNYNDYATDIVIGKDDEITVAGYSTNDTWKKIILTRYKVDGNIDEDFGTNGIVTVVDDAEIVGTNLSMDSFERIIIRTDLHSLYRFKKDGSADATYGNNGVVDIQTPYNKTSLVNMSVDIEDRILVLGNGSDGENTGAFLIRYNVDGSIDNNFGDGGFTDVAKGEMFYEGVDLTINEKGGILVTAIYDDGHEHSWTKRGDISILAYTEDGWIDDNFNDDGIVKTEISESAEQVKFIGIDPIGNIFVAGTKIININTSIHHDFFAAKYFGSTKVGEPGANVGSKDFAMNQNYPNPFNPTTTIRFKIPLDNNVTLKVYNMLGQEVAVLVNEYKSAGLYKVTFDATNLPSGIYVYRLDAGSFTEVHKMILLK